MVWALLEVNLIAGYSYHIFGCLLRQLWNRRVAQGLVVGVCLDGRGHILSHFLGLALPEIADVTSLPVSAIIYARNRCHIHSTQLFLHSLSALSQLVGVKRLTIVEGRAHYLMYGLRRMEWWIDLGLLFRGWFTRDSKFIMLIQWRRYRIHVDWLQLNLAFNHPLAWSLYDIHVGDLSIRRLDLLKSCVGIAGIYFHHGLLFRSLRNVLFTSELGWRRLLIGTISHLKWGSDFRFSILKSFPLSDHYFSTILSVSSFRSLARSLNLLVA